MLTGFTRLLLGLLAEFRRMRFSLTVFRQLLDYCSWFDLITSVRFDLVTSVRFDVVTSVTDGVIGLTS